MRVKDLQIGEMYFSKSHQLMMKYCGVEYFHGRKYHNFYESSWRLFHWLSPQDVSLPNKRMHLTGGSVPVRKHFSGL